MNKNFTNDDLEDFLKESADGLRMHPSNKVWKGISKNLNERRRRMAFATGTFLLLTSVLGYFLVTDSRNSLQSATTAHAAVNAGTIKNPQVPNNTQPITKSYIAPVVDKTNAEQRNMIAKANPESAPAIIRKLIPRMASGNKPAVQNSTPVRQEEAFIGTVTDDNFAPNIEASTPVADLLSTVTAQPPYTIESVTNTFKNFSRKKVSFQFFFTPTVSYRKLTENKSYLRGVPSTGATSYAELYDINDIVTHKPDMGLEFGMAAKYPVAKNVNVRAGLQFNISRYGIKAFNNSTELATIALNNGNNNIQVLGTQSNYRNFGSVGKADWLQNMSFQVSAPVGAEVKVAGSSKGTSFGVAGTIQPSYVLSDRAYILSTDYKNYSEVPWLMRRWNVATSVETFVAYSTGKIKWQVGPQIRYQLLSSFVTKYPVKENLFDFGLKVGISLNDKKWSQTNK